MNHLSPLRYPGGKARLAPLLETVIERNGLRKCTYYEPYAGGAGAALGLLESGVVENVCLNDKDFRVYAFWRAALRESERFIDRLARIQLTVKEWNAQREIVDRPRSHRLFDVGFATFYMNRCNRSGIVTGAGPIGGFDQKGRWTIDVRFNRVGLRQRIENLAKYRDKIRVYQKDAIEFLKERLPRGNQRSRVFVYLDPPYVQKGQRLYLLPSS